MRGAGAAALLTVLATGCGGEPTPDQSRMRAAAGMAALDGWYFGSLGQWTEHWWNSANSLTVLVDYTARTGDATFRPHVAEVYDKNQAKQFLNDYYDDEGWWALAWIAAYDLAADPRYLAAAKTIFTDMAAGWDATCNGGIWWDKAKTYKNAISNALFLEVAARLHARTSGDAGPGSYLDWAQREWAWLQASGILDGGDMVNDGVDMTCKPLAPPQLWTYNAGVLAGGLAALGELDRAAAVADAARAHFSDGDGVLHEKCEPTCDADAVQFKGIFVRNLAALDALRPTPAWEAVIATNAAAVWDKDRAGPGGSATDENSFGLVWSGPFDSADPVRQTSALDVLVAAVQR